MKNLMFLLFLLPLFSFAQDEYGVKVKVMSVEMLALTDAQLRIADRIEQQYQKRLKDAIKIMSVDRQEAHLKIAMAALSANHQYLSMLSSEQRSLWEEVLATGMRSRDQKELQLNSEGKSRTIALAVR